MGVRKVTSEMSDKWQCGIVVNTLILNLHRAQLLTR